MAKKQSITQTAQGTAIAQALYGGIANVNVYQDVSVHPVDSATLAAAQQQLAQIPLGTIPDIAPLPSGSRVPFRHNPFFVGRASDLRVLASTLKDEGSEKDYLTTIAAITGIGGVGKTQLATEFVHRYGQYFAGGVFWLSFAEANAIPDQVAECGRSGHLNLRADFHNLPPEDQISLVLGAWQSAMPRLLVFDNCEDETLLAQWSPPTGASHVLITSRSAEWDTMLSIKSLPLRELQLADSVQLLHSYTPELQASNADFADIATELGNLPLALHLAGSFLSKFHRVLTPQAYLAQLRKADLLEHSSLTSGGISATAHEQNVRETFEVSYRNLESKNATDSQALALLSRATYFAPGEPIPHHLLLATLESANASEETPLQAESALIRLLELGLVEWVNESERTLRIHRLLVKFLQQKNTAASAQYAVEQALATEYEQIRAQSSPGARRTIKMNQLVARVRGFAEQASYTPAEIQRIFDTGTAGNQIVATALTFMRPDPLNFGSLLEAIRNSKSAFEQYHALLAVRVMLPKLDDTQKGELEAVLQDGAENIKNIAQDSSREIIRVSILGMLRQSPEVQLISSDEQHEERGWSTLLPHVPTPGWIPDLLDQRGTLFVVPEVILQQLPLSVDLSFHCPPIYDQSQIEIDTLNAIAAIIQFHMMREGMQDFIPSRLFIYYNARAMEEVETDSGIQIRNGLKSISKYGVCPEDMWPYDIARIQERPPDACYKEALKYRAILYQRISRTLNEMKGCLACGLPFIFGFLFDESFESAEVVQIGHVSLPESGVQVLGGHVMLAVGYDDRQECFLVRNSRGTNWGMQGYFTMPYAYLMDPKLANDFWTIRMPGEYTA
jgi:C1A family cysteine protease